MTRNKRVSAEKKKEIVELVGSGQMSVTEAGREFGVHPVTIGNWIKKSGQVDEGPTLRERELEKKLAQAERRLGQMSVELEFFKKLHEDILRRQRKSGGLIFTAKNAGAFGGPAK
jgi:transposase-like protein